MTTKTLSQAASAMGKKGGAVKSKAKAKAAKQNGKLGGRPKMSIQATLNKRAFDILHATAAAMRNADDFDRSQMQACTLRKLGNISPCLDDMNTEQREELDAGLINHFRAMSWLA